MKDRMGKASLDWHRWEELRKMEGYFVVRLKLEAFECLDYGFRLVQVELKRDPVLRCLFSGRSYYGRVALNQRLQEPPLLFNPPFVNGRHQPLVAIVDTRITSLGRTPCSGRGRAKSSDCPFQTTWGSPSPCRISPRSRRSYRISSSTWSRISSSSISTLNLLSPTIVSK